MNYGYSGYPDGCPPVECEESCGTYFRVARNKEPADPEHFKSYFQLGKATNPEDCKARALSLKMTREQAISLIDKVGESIGRYVFVLDLKGGHGKVRRGNPQTGHCIWWVPDQVNPVEFITGVEGPL